MKTGIFGQLLIFCTISFSAAADIGDSLRQSTDSFEASNCVERSQGIITTLSGLNTFDFKDEINRKGHGPLLQDLWDFKIALHEKLRSLNKEEVLVKDCADSIRGVFRVVRNVEDVVSEDYYRKRSHEINFPDDSFGADNLHVKKHPEMSDFDFLKDLKSGDIILSRGKAYTSAAISSLGEFDTQFSHLSVVYRDENGKLWTVESHIEVGSFVRPIEDHIKDKNFRTMVYRFEDEILAHEAAKYIYHKVKNASDSTGNIFYDFAFNQEDSRELFCSEVASHAFDFVSNGRVKLPMFRSRLLSRKPEFVKKLGITASESFIPADIEIDPRFKVISEWRNAAIIPDITQKDAVLRAMFHWSDKYGYQLIQGVGKKAFLYRNVAWPLRRVPYFKKYFIEKLPVNMSRKLIGYFGVMESVGEYLQENLKVEDSRSLENKGLSLLLTEKYEALDKIRRDDLLLKRPKLHKMFRPVGKNN